MAVLLSVATFFSTLTGGMVALRARDRLHLLLGFTAGVVLGVVAFDLLPEVFSLPIGHVGSVPAVMLTFAAGFLVLHLIERSAVMHGAHEEDYGTHQHRHVGVVSGLALSAHSFMDGVSIGLAFRASSSVGILVALAVIGHDFADGLNTVSVVRMHGNDRRRSIALLLLDAVAPVLGAASTLLFRVPDHVLGLYLGFFAGFLLYLATADILPQAHSARHSGWTFLMTFLGMGAMWLLISQIGG